MVSPNYTKIYFTK